MLRTVSGRLRAGKVLGLFVFQQETAVTTNGSLVCKLRPKSSLTSSGIPETALPCVTACRYHHTHRRSRDPLQQDCDSKNRQRYRGVSEALYLHATTSRMTLPLSVGEVTSQIRLYSSSGDKQTPATETRETSVTKESDDDKDEDGKPKGIFRRFKDAYKTYGKAMIGVHVVTSSVWFGAFYFAAAQGLDVVPLLEWIGAGDKVISTFKLPGVGNAAVAYLCYKLATPARYTVTLVGTQQFVKYMRRWGYWEPIKPEDSLRSLMREGRENVKDRVDDVRDKVKVKVKDKVGDVKGGVKGTFTDMKGEFKDVVSDWKVRRGEQLKGDAHDLKDQGEGVAKEFLKKLEKRSKMDRFK